MDSKNDKRVVVFLKNVALLGGTIILLDAAVNQEEQLTTTHSGMDNTLLPRSGELFLAERKYTQDKKSVLARFGTSSASHTWDLTAVPSVDRSYVLQARKPRSSGRG